MSKIEMKEPAAFSKAQDLEQWVLKRKMILARLKALPSTRGTESERPSNKKTKAVIKTNLAELCVVQQRATQADSVQEQAGKMISPLDEGLSFRIFIQWHCSLFFCCSGPH